MPTEEDLLPRSIPVQLAPLVERLELERPQMVTRAALSKMLAELGIATPIEKVVNRLRTRGWLLPTGVRGVYEFAPAERAGPYSEGDSLRALRATLLYAPELPLAVALGSALWLINIADRRPEQAEIAFPRNPQLLPVGLRRGCRIVRHTWHLAPTIVRGVPVHRPATILVHLAHRPSHVRSWSAMMESLPALVALTSEAEVLKEIGDRPHATKIRLAYLLSSLAPQLAAAVHTKASGKVWFGPRGKLRRHNAALNVADTILPYSPTELKQSS